MNEYEGRINRVIDFVRAHLDEKLTLEQLAKIACFSPFHFHRVFAAYTGETVHELVLRLRVQRATTLLATRPRMAITEVALECGFGSPSSFARAFRGYLGVTASEFRQRLCAPGDEDRKIGQTVGKDGTASPPRPSYARTMDVQIKRVPPFHVLYARRMGPYGAGIAEAWQRLAAYAGPRGLLGPETPKIGIGHDDPHVTPPEKCRYDACIPVSADTKAERGFGLADIPGGTAAVFRYEGPREGIAAAYGEIYGGWLPKSGYKPIDHPSYEIFVEGPEVRPGVLAFDICLLIEPE